MGNSDCDAWFRQVVGDHMGILLKTAHGFASGAADRDDLVQEMLLAVWQALPTYNQTCTLSTFVYRVAHNRALNWRRSRARYDRRLDHYAQMPHLALAGNDADEKEQQLEWLYAIIRQLPPIDRTLIMLHLDGLSHQEVAEVAGLSANNVGVRLHRIKQWLSSQKPSDPQ
jgi:RNA polymerase sigma-70 factor (ECF subfamily)